MNEVKRIYDRMAADYDRYVTPCRICQFLILAHELNLNGGERVLELGSGPGVLSTHLAKVLSRGEVTGLDLSDRMVELASEKVRDTGLTNVKFVQGDALGLQFSDGAFDAVVSSYLVHWVPDVDRYFSEIHRVLKVGGKLGIIAPSPDMYGELREAYRTIILRHPVYYEGSQVSEMIGLKVLSDEQLLGTLKSAGFGVQRYFQLNFKERLGPEAYIRRVNAITDERYLEPVPPNERDMVREELMLELATHCRSEVLTTECSIFVIGTREA